MTIKRLLNLETLLGPDLSGFLFGARGTGKTILIESYLQKFPNSLYIQLLDLTVLKQHILDSSLFYRQVSHRANADASKKLLVVIDEIQKAPWLLDGVHLLMNEFKNQIQFLLTGSSARKLKQQGVNLLAGRALTMFLFPLSYREIKIDLLDYLQFGSLPKVFLATSPAVKRRLLRAYIETYLKEEIRQEAATRKVEAFVRFLDIAAQMNSEPINYSNLARDCGVSPKTAAEYFQILEDTLLAYRLSGFAKSERKQVLAAPKFYFFDCGVLNALRGQLNSPLAPSSFYFGKLFESLVIQEAFRQNLYNETDFKFSYWRTNTGSEVDLIISQDASYETGFAIEIKSKAVLTASDLRSLKSFVQENPGYTPLCFSTVAEPYHVEEILILPWQQGLAKIFGY